jgi:hypothetical protein
MDPATISLGLQAIGLVRGGAGSSIPSITSTSGSRGKTIIAGDINSGMDMGAMSDIAFWSTGAGGNGPGQAMAFQRPDSFVMGLTGLSTTGNGYALGNGIAVKQPAAITNSIFQNPWMWGAVGLVAIALFIGRKK